MLVRQLCGLAARLSTLKAGNRASKGTAPKRHAEGGGDGGGDGRGSDGSGVGERIASGENCVRTASVKAADAAVTRE